MKNENFAVGTCAIKLILHGNSSLKGKRSILNRIKKRTSNNFNVSISEVGDNDSLQSALIAVVSVSNDKQYLDGQLAKVVDFIASLTEAEVANVETNIEIRGSEDYVFL